MTEVHAFARFLFLDVEFTGKCALLGGKKRSSSLKSYNYFFFFKKGNHMLLQPNSKLSCQYHPGQKTSRNTVIHPNPTRPSYMELHRLIIISHFSS